MKEFFRNVFAALVALMIAGFASLFLFGIIVGVIAGSSSDTFVLKDNTIMTLNLEGSLSDRISEENPFLDILPMDQASEMGLDDILSSIKKAKENDKIKGIYIKSGAFNASTASLSEVRTALEDFKTSGKFIVAYSDNYTQQCYYLASVADKVILNPQGHLDFHGLAVAPTYYKGLFDKLGVEMQIFKVGTYKSAVEPYILDKMSDANREQVTAFATDIWSNMVKSVSESRKISPQQLNALADTMVLFQDQKMLVETKMVDTLLYETQVSDYLKSLVKVDKDDKLQLASVKNMQSVPFKDKNDAKEQIAILYAEGDIMSGTTKSMGQILDGVLIKEIEKLRKDENVKAVVFRVNSPGGSAYASEQIWKAITDLKAEKPVVVSMGNYAASGGYYISCNASKIIAQPTTLTGSIGIFGMFPNIEGLTKKVGLSYDGVKTNKHGDFGDISRPMREDEKKLMQTYIERGYDLFVTRCAEGRNIPKDSLMRIAEGRVWTGNQALKLGLVDGLGGIDVAIKEAATLAKLEKYSTKAYPRKTDFFENLFSNKKDELVTRAMKEYLGADYSMIKRIKEIDKQDYMQARIAYDLEIK